MKRKILSLILVFAMTVSLLTVGTGAVEPTYGDTAGHWAESSIERWSAYGIIQGSNGQFDPNGQLTCAQLATILAKLLKLPAAKDAGFTDNTADAWYYDAINRCAAAGILNGNGDGTVTPEAPITRERAMVMLARALGIEPIRKPDLTKYTDAAQVSAYAQGYVAALIEAGIVGGVTADELAPQDNITRAATVTILDRAIGTYADKAGATVKADGKGIVLVVAENVKITGAPEGTKIVVADGATGLTVNGKSVSDDQTYIVPKTTTGSGSSSGGYSHTHTWGDWTITKEPTCAETGTRTRTCAGCGQVETATIEKLAHTPGIAATCTTAQFCTVCGEKLADALGHSWVEDGTEEKCGTTINKYKCNRENCTETKTEAVGNATHVGGTTEVAAVAATCTTAGTTAGTKCSTCGVILSGCETDPALGHDFVDAWTTTGEETHWHACQREGCDAKSMEAAHTYGEVMTDWADPSLKTSKTCAVCSKTVDLAGENTYYIATVDDLKAFAAKVNDSNNFSDKTVKLTADIDLENKEWTPIGKSGSTFQGTFDGQEHTISNLKTGSSWESDVGLFGVTTNGEVKNFTLQNANVTGYLDVGAIAGTPYTSKYTNITLRGKITVNGYAYVGGAFGKNAYADLTNITINVESGSYVKADSENYRTYVGGLVGFMGEGDQVVKNVTSNIDVIGSTCDVGGITGIAHYGNTFENCSSSGNVTLLDATDEGDHLEIGGIAGVWMNEADQTVTFTNCSFAGTLSTTLKGEDKTSELNALHRIAGRKYTPDSNDGTLIIDGAIQVLAATQDDLNDTISKATAEEKISVNLTTAGTYTLPSLANKSITISGTKDTVIDMENKLNNGASNISFEGVTVKFGTNDYKGFQHTGKLTYKDCTITGKQFLYGTEVEFINCSFMQDVVDYNVWTYGAGKVLFKDCKFNCKGKSVLIYNEGALKAQTVEFQNCSFNASVKADGKAAIEIDSRFTSYTVTIDQATANNVIGFANGSVSNNSLWNVKAHTKPVTVTVDSTVMYNQ